MDKRNRLIAALHREGNPVRAIAERVGLSKSRVQQILTVANRGNGDDDYDELDDDELDELDDLDAELDALNAERWPVPPLVFVGRERQWFSLGDGNGGYWADMERWLDANGDRVGDEHEAAEMALYRLVMHITYELEDPERADALQADWQRQRDEYDARARARRARVR